MKLKYLFPILFLSLIFSFFSCAGTPSDTEVQAPPAPLAIPEDLPAPPDEEQYEDQFVDQDEDQMEIEISDSPGVDSFPEIILPPPGLVMERPDLPELPLPEFVFPEQPVPEEPIVEIAEDSSLEESPLMEEAADDLTSIDEPQEAMAPQPAPAAEGPPAPAPAPSPVIPPAPPPFIAPAEPIPPPVQQPLPVPALPFPDLPSRPLPETPAADIVFSRTVRATVGQIVEIPFTGIGWVYLGELANRQGLRYESRRLDVQAGITLGQSFIFHCEEPGTFILRFYRHDFIQDYIINDHVQVIVGEADIVGASPPERGRVIAQPRWPVALGPLAPGPSAIDPPALAPEPLGPRPPWPLDIDPEADGYFPYEFIPDEDAPPWLSPDLADDGLVTPAPPQTAFRADPVLTLAEYLSQAREEFDAGRIENALSIMDTMIQHYPQGSDEAWWLYAQLLEANSPNRDIALALEFYRRIISEYPMSNRVGDAQRRIAYLERFYFNIR